jgi:hypothetical protein
MTRNEKTRGINAMKATLGGRMSAAAKLPNRVGIPCIGPGKPLSYRTRRRSARRLGNPGNQ